MGSFLLDQPDEYQLAAYLKGLLKRPETLKFEAVVAFAVSSGVEELESELESLLERGGSIRIVVGVSNRVTTIEGLKLLLELARKGAQVFVFHNDDPSNPIFHPKLYLCEGKGRAVLIVGSSNMTGKGLVGNYEISLVQQIDVKDAPDAELAASVEKIIGKYCDVASGFSRPLDEKFLQELEAEGYVGSERGGTNRPETSGESEAGAVSSAPRKKLFSSKSVPQAARRRTPVAATGVRPPRPTVAAIPVAGVAAAAPAARRGPIVWRKRLAASDVQSQTGHPTGVVRLTQAKWKVDSKLIDWTKYFRQRLFGGVAWRVAKQKPFVEETEIQFDITILGVNVGVHRLKVSDKPSGEAGQRNYTSSLHWGELGNSIRKAKLAHKTLTLYGPPAGSNEPFFIEIF